jgi:hypothetical protein
MKYLLLFVVIIFSKTLLAQDSTVSSVVIHKDPRLDVLVKKQSDVNLAIRRASARTAKGYRILVVNTNKRDEAIAAKTKIYTNFPELKAYLVYQSPYFKLKAGNFKTRDEALQYQKVLSAYFPKGVFVVNDTIEVTPEKDDK